ncbi:hypothetical protein FB474_2360 [Oryzihumus leptocrescens]|uniref:Uncharacterized protein n=1 Tax=Oryzihumus leptocrescens TaxID=297536 RepID=A0A542ZKS3_9MICO|nr:hypothetical protein FB474_2360 [Oryzihumus leptocrescens]
MASWGNEGVVDRWIERALGLSNAAFSGDFTDRQELHVDAGGRLRLANAPMASPIGPPGAVRLWLLNADPQVSIGRHQALVRDRLQRTGIPTLSLPFAVLGAAGIEHDTIDLIHDTPDGFTDVDVRSINPPLGMRSEREPIMGWVRLTEAEIATRLRVLNSPDYKRLGWLSKSGHADFAEAGPVTRAVLTAQPHGLERWAPVGWEQVLRAPLGGRVTLQPGEDGNTVYLWSAPRRRPGESLIWATAVHTGRCPACRGTGRVGRSRWAGCAGPRQRLRRLRRKRPRAQPAPHRVLPVRLRPPGRHPAVLLLRAPRRRVPDHGGRSL